MRKWAHLSWDTGLNGQRHEAARTAGIDQQNCEDRPTSLTAAPASSSSRSSREAAIYESISNSVGQAGVQTDNTFWELYCLAPSIMPNDRMPSKHEPRAVFADLEPRATDKIHIAPTNSFPISEPGKLHPVTSRRRYTTGKEITDLTYKSILPTHTNLEHSASMVDSDAMAGVPWPGSVKLCPSSLLASDLDVVQTKCQTNLVPHVCIHFLLITYAPVTSTEKTCHKQFSVAEVTKVPSGPFNLLIGALWLQNWYQLPAFHNGPGGDLGKYTNNTTAILLKPGLASTMSLISCMSSVILFTSK
ncbi:Tubulin alpha-3 chain, partial [Galemys pyrenaicus]